MVCFCQVWAITLRYLEGFVGLTSFVLGLSFRQNLFKCICTPETLANVDIPQNRNQRSHVPAINYVNLELNSCNFQLILCDI